tara:strand:+ start:5759 stop:5902 length:144 start_codon:yes stop_codon:yes gene_type:complete
MNLLIILSNCDSRELVDLNLYMKIFVSITTVVCAIEDKDNVQKEFLQ